MATSDESSMLALSYNNSVYNTVAVIMVPNCGITLQIIGLDDYCMHCMEDMFSMIMVVSMQFEPIKYCFVSTNSFVLLTARYKFYLLTCLLTYLLTYLLTLL